MYRYVDSDGSTRELADDTALADAIREGSVSDATPLAVGPDGGWRPARAQPAYRSARGGAGPRARRPVPRRSIVVVALLGGLTWAATRAASSPPGPDAESEALATAVADVVAGRTPDPAVVTAPPPATREGRIRWVTLHSVLDTRDELAALRRRHGIESFEPAGDWLTSNYVLAARSKPEVRRHWEAWLAFDRESRETIAATVERTLRARAAEAGVGDRDLEAMLAGAERVVQTRRDLRGDMAAYAEAAIRFHDHLATARDHPRVRDGAYVFSEAAPDIAFRSALYDLQNAGTRLEARYSRMAHALGSTELADLVVATGGPPHDGGRWIPSVDPAEIRSSVDAGPASALEYPGRRLPPEEGRQPYSPLRRR